MQEVFPPWVRIAVAVVVICVPVVWLIVFFAVKVLRWPSRRTVERWARKEERAPYASGPMTPMLITVTLGLLLPVYVGAALLAHFDTPASSPPFEGVLAGTAVVLALAIPAGLWWRRSRPRELVTGSLSGPFLRGGEPEWTEDAGGYQIEVRGKPLSMARLTGHIIFAVLVSGAILTGVILVLHTGTGLEPGRRQIVLLGLLLAVLFPGAWLFFLRRGIAAYRVAITSQGVRIASDRDSFEWTWAQIDRLTVRTDSDYARVGIRSRVHGDFTLMIGVMNRGRGTTNLPYTVRALVVDQGFTEQFPPLNAPGLHRFTPADS